jgi:methionyl-tRNA formyltransferase
MITQRLIFLGTRGVLSLGVLEALLRQGREVVGIGVAGEGRELVALSRPNPIVSELPMVASFVGQSIVEVGWQQGIPVWEAGRLDEEAVAAVRVMRPSAIVVACWPRLIPEALLEMPKWGVLNVHPSRLPEFRGPAPIFWQLRAGLREIGVTVHRMSRRFDEGPVLAQAPLVLPEGTRGEEIDKLVAELGGRLVGEVLDGLEAGTVNALPQAAGSGSYHGWPMEEDFAVPPEWTARRAWNFMRGAAEWGVPFTISTADGMLVAREVLEFEPDATLPEPLVFEAGRFGVQFAPGVVWVAGSRVD